MGRRCRIVGTPDRSSSCLGVPIGDSLARTVECLGALAALQERKASGRGQVIAISVYEAMLQIWSI